MLFPPDLQNEDRAQTDRLYRRLWWSYEGLVGLLGSRLKKGWKRTPRPWRRVLAMAATELMWDGPEKAYAVLHSWGEISREVGGKAAQGVINGVLRGILRDLESENLSLQDVLSDRWMAPGVDLEAHWRILDGPRRVFWFGLEEQVFDGLESVVGSDVGEPCRLCRGVAPEVVLEERGGFVQNLAAAELCLEVSKRMGEGRLLDFCAAPGGKTWQLARLGVPQVHYHDVNPKRLKLMEDSAVRRALGERVKAWAGAGTFDGVLIDVPCSNSGVLAKCPEAMRHGWLGEDSFAEVQNSTLTEAAAFVGEGGTLFYSTCSVDPLENEQRVRSWGKREGWELQFSRTWWPDDQGRHGAHLSVLSRV